MNRVRGLLGTVICCMLVACGGGSGGGGGVGGAAGGQDGSGSGSGGGGSAAAQLPAYAAGVFPAYSSLANMCEFPRPGTNDVRGSAHTEKMFLRSWSNDLYLWYQDIVERDPAGLSVEDYFLDHLKSNGLDEGGQRKDRFHYTHDTAEYRALSQSGLDLDYGVQWSIVRAQPPRRIEAVYVEPNSPAALNGLRRGDRLLGVDSVDVVSDNTRQGVETLIAALSPSAVGERHVFVVNAAYNPADAERRTISMSAQQIIIDPVPLVRTLDHQGVPVGYLLFNDHIATAEYELVRAIEQLRDDNVQELVLDLRYNGGGYLDIANQLAYMIAGPALTDGRAFESLRFNDKHPSTNPVTGQPLAPTGFHRTSLGFSSPQLLAAGTALPTLALSRVYMIVGENTCSASETIINGLRGVGVDVYLIGGTTCGKPYGFYGRDNCGTMYFSVQMQTLNDVGFGAYSGGFAAGYGRSGSVSVSGCPVEDDLAHELGDTREARLNAALAFNASNHRLCSDPTLNGAAQRKGAPYQGDGQIRKSLVRSNLLLRDQALSPISTSRDQP